MMAESEHRALLLSIFQAALDRVNGREAVRRHLQEQGVAEGSHVVAIGKAACAMAQGALDVLGDSKGDVLVITKTGHLEALCRDAGITCFEADHPVPDERSLEAGQQLLNFVDERADGPILFLISGGASSLVEVLPEGLGLEHLATLTKWLLGSGLPIQEMNRIRRSLSCIKGGKLLGHLKQEAQAEVLLISDVMGDDLAAIGSGLLFPAPASIDAEELPETIRSWWRSCDVQPATRSVRHSIVASLGQAMQASADRARSLGFDVFVHETPLEGDAGNTGIELARVLKQELPRGIHIWGGETTVQLPEHPGRGGRNQHLALSAALECAGEEGIFLLSAGTDGTDGPTEDAGALINGETLRRGSIEGLSATACLQTADSGSFLAASGDLISTGPTGTNVMDLVIALKN
jgi:glycerate 2-kinase